MEAKPNVQRNFSHEPLGLNSVLSSILTTITKAPNKEVSSPQTYEKVASKMEDTMFSLREKIIENPKVEETLGNTYMLYLGFQTIAFDKLNKKRQTRLMDTFFKNYINKNLSIQTPRNTEIGEFQDRFKLSYKQAKVLQQIFKPLNLDYDPGTRAEKDKRTFYYETFIDPKKLKKQTPKNKKYQEVIDIFTQEKEEASVLKGTDPEAEEIRDLWNFTKQEILTKRNPDSKCQIEEYDKVISKFESKIETDKDLLDKAVNMKEANKIIISSEHILAISIGFCTAVYNKLGSGLQTRLQFQLCQLATSPDLSLIDSKGKHAKFFGNRLILSYKQSWIVKQLAKAFSHDYDPGGPENTPKNLQKRTINFDDFIGRSTTNPPGLSKSQPEEIEKIQQYVKNREYRYKYTN